MPLSRDEYDKLKEYAVNASRDQGHTYTVTGDGKQSEHKGYVVSADGIVWAPADYVVTERPRVKPGIVTSHVNIDEMLEAWEDTREQLLASLPVSKKQTSRAEFERAIREHGERQDLMLLQEEKLRIERQLMAVDTSYRDEIERIE